MLKEDSKKKKKSWKTIIPKIRTENGLSLTALGEKMQNSNSSLSVTSSPHDSSLSPSSSSNNNNIAQLSPMSECSSNNSIDSNRYSIRKLSDSNSNRRNSSGNSNIVLSSPPRSPTSSSSSMGINIDVKSNVMYHHDGFLRAINDDFDRENIPFCFKCGCEKEMNYVYINTVQKIAYKYGVFNIDNNMIQDPPIYREIYVCQECYDCIVQLVLKDSKQVIPIYNDANKFYWK